MLFSSYEFVFAFLPLVLAGYVLAARAGSSHALLWLVAASLFFYGWWNPAYLPLLAGSILFNFALGRGIAALRARRAQAHRPLLVAGIVANLGLLAWFKYAGFFLDTSRALTGAHWTTADIVLPIGISFFTFQQIAYLVDVARGETHEESLIRYSLFVAFFPQLIAGPIVHHKEMLPQFRRHNGLRLRYEDLTIGLVFFAAGLFKKAFVADSLALPANTVFDAAEAGEPLHFFLAWKGALAYTFQIYFDFSGYSDMAVGLGRMFGIRLPFNFDSPYRAANIIDFWRRWHMTLSRFLRDYLYIPLGGSRRGRVRRYVNLMITMVLGGLWHGAGWTFVFWGALHGVYLMVNHLWRMLWRWPVGTWWSRGLSYGVTFLAVVVGWVFFRAESFAGALAVLRGMVNLPHTLADRLGPLVPLLTSLGIRFEGPYISYDDLLLLPWLAGFLAFLLLAPNTQQWLDGTRNGQGSTRVPWPARAAYTGGLLALGILGLSQVNEFLYFQF